MPVFLFDTLCSIKMASSYSLSKNRWALNNMYLHSVMWLTHFRQTKEIMTFGICFQGCFTIQWNHTKSPTPENAGYRLISKVDYQINLYHIFSITGRQMTQDVGAHYSHFPLNYSYGFPWKKVIAKVLTQAGDTPCVAWYTWINVTITYWESPTVNVTIRHNTHILLFRE